MYKDFYCAYHHTQIITQFCKCKQCLLPVCQSCIKLHTEQHQINKTQPLFQKQSSYSFSLKNIYLQVQKQLQQLENKTKALVQILIRKQNLRKNQMNNLKQQITIKRKQIIQQFQKALINMDTQIIQSIHELDNQFINQIETIDDQILQLQQVLQTERKSLRSQESLRTVIGYFESDKYKLYQSQIERIETQIQKFICIKINLKIQQNMPKIFQGLLQNLITFEQQYQQY